MKTKPIAPPSFAVCALLIQHTVYAHFYIIGLNILLFYHHAGHTLRRYFTRLFRRVKNTCFRVIIYPFVLLFRGIKTHRARPVISGLTRISLLLCVTAILIGIIQFRRTHTLALAVSYEGKPIGYVADHEVVRDGTAHAQQMMQFYTMNQPPVASFAVAPTGELINATQLGQAMIGCHSDQLTPASGLFIDGVYAGAVADRTELETLLNTLRTAGENGTETRPSEFVQKVEIHDGAYPHELLLSAQQLKEKLESTRNEPVYYTVKSGDNLIAIARSCQMTLAELRKLNPAFSASDLLHIGDRLMIKPSSALLQARVYRQITYKETIPFETKVWQDKNHYIGEKNIVVRGVNGEQEVVAEIALTDGVETARTVLKTTVLKQPVTQKMQVGSKKGKRPVGNGIVTGNFAWPLPRYTTITSPYGARWGTVHQGIDISGYNVFGKSIVAADGGTVYAVNSTSSWGTGMFAGYGYAVIIDHGKGLKTLYAHCSSVVVKAGQKVSRGQTIAYVGSTGKSTGPHLHFEVRVNNKRVDPLPYLLH